MILPALLAILIPIVTGIILGVAGVIGLLVSGLSTGFVLAVMMANAGGAWDNAKKYIEKGAHGGKGSEAHKAAVVGDTVGDPFKDTSGPSLNILIKLMSMVSIVFAGVTVAVGPLVGNALGIEEVKSSAIEITSQVSFPDQVRAALPAQAQKALAQVQEAVGQNNFGDALQALEAVEAQLILAHAGGFPAETTEKARAALEETRTALQKKSPESQAQLDALARTLGVAAPALPEETTESEEPAAPEQSTGEATAAPEPEPTPGPE